MFAGRLDRLSHSSGVDPLLPALRQRFQTALNTALVVGRPPECATDLGPRTLAAVALIAAEHPDASAQIIAAAYDTFLDEHGWHNPIGSTGDHGRLNEEGIAGGRQSQRG